MATTSSSGILLPTSKLPTSWVLGGIIMRSAAGADALLLGSQCPTGHLSSYGMRVTIHKRSNLYFEFASETERDTVSDSTFALCLNQQDHLLNYLSS